MGPVEDRRAPVVACNTPPYARGRLLLGRLSRRGARVPARTPSTAGSRTHGPSHTARAAGWGPRRAAPVRSRRSGGHVVSNEQPRTALNTALWLPRWHRPEAA